MSFNAKNALRFAGDVNIDKAVIVTSKGVFQDVTGQTIQIQIFEDLFSPFISGSLILKDALDLTNVLPLIGEEYLQLTVSTPTLQNGSISGTFHIYKMSDKAQVGDRATAYELNFISVESLVDINKKISKVFSGKISDIAGSLALDKQDGFESSKKFNIEPTRNSIKYISNFWSPLKNFQYMADNSISESQSPSFLFFENRDGFNFRSLEALYSGEVKQTFTYDRYTRDNFPLGGNSLNILEDYKRVDYVIVDRSYDFMDRIRSGMLGSKLISYDSTKKSYTAKNYSAINRFNSQIHLNPNPLFTDSAVVRSFSKVITYPRAFETFTSFGDTTNARILQERISFLKMAEAQKVQIHAPGRCDYTVGMVVSLLLYQSKPLRRSDTIDEMTDKILSGKYLVSAINHTISPEGHECTLELVKDSYIKEI